MVPKIMANPLTERTFVNNLKNGSGAQFIKKYFQESAQLNKIQEQMVETASGKKAYISTRKMDNGSEFFVYRNGVNNKVVKMILDSDNAILAYKETASIKGIKDGVVGNFKETVHNPFDMKDRISKMVKEISDMAKGYFTFPNILK